MQYVSGPGRAKFGEGPVPNLKPYETGQRAGTVRGFLVVRLLAGASARSTAFDLFPREASLRLPPGCRQTAPRKSTRVSSTRSS